MIKPKVSIIIVYHNSYKQTIRCLESVNNLNYSNYSITLVDDTSTDGSSLKIKKKFPNVNIIISKKELWCNESFNVGIQHSISKGENLFFLLNNDNTVSPDSLSYIVDTYLNTDYKIIGSLISSIQHPDITTHSGKIIDWKTLDHISLNQNKEILKIKKRIYEVDCLGFQGVLISKEVFEKIGFIDSANFIQYAGDYDFYLKAKKSDFKVVVDTKSIVFDDLMTKGDLNNTISLMYFIKSIISIKSISNYLARYHFYKFHSPYFWLYSFGKYYIKLFYNYLKTLSHYLINLF